MELSKKESIQSVKRSFSLLLSLVLLLSIGSTAVAVRADDVLRIENGAPQPILKVSNLRAPDYSNEDSDILRFCVYVETDYDSDSDGMADLVEVLVQVPRPAVEGKYKAASIYDPTPYGTGTYRDPSTSSYQVLYREKRFDYDSLYKPCDKRKAEGEMSSMDAALSARPEKDWNYSVPVSGEQGYAYAEVYDYYLARGYAVVEASGIGTYGSEGFELCSTHLERDSHVAVVEWLTGDRRAGDSSEACQPKYRLRGADDHGCAGGCCRQWRAI